MVSGLISRLNLDLTIEVDIRNMVNGLISYFPVTILLLGSVPTPYIFDDRAEPFDIAEAIDDLYQVKTKQAKRKSRSNQEWK